MRKISMTLAAAAVLVGSLASAPSAFAAQASHDTTVDTRPAAPAAPAAPVQPLDCQGTTGGMGCGPGWIWRDGWRGWACYPC
jgi:hypothetical protein